MIEHDIFVQSVVMTVYTHSAIYGMLDWSNVFCNLQKMHMD